MPNVQIFTDSELWPINKVIPYHRNIKKHLDPQVNRLADAILAFGWDQAIVVDSDGVIIKGHCRLAAAKKLELTEVPVIVRSDLSSDKIKASRIADNKLAESDWDIDNLKLELDDLGDIDFDIEVTGFNDDELSDLFGGKKKEVIGAKELSEESFTKFIHVCPKCGFEFDK